MDLIAVCQTCIDWVYIDEEPATYNVAKLHIKDNPGHNVMYFDNEEYYSTPKLDRLMKRQPPWEDPIFDVIVKFEAGMVRTRCKASQLPTYFAGLDMATVLEYTVKKV